jgi:hypothetical protein
MPGGGCDQQHRCGQQRQHVAGQLGRDCAEQDQAQQQPHRGQLLQTLDPLLRLLPVATTLPKLPHGRQQQGPPRPDQAQEYRQVEEQGLVVAIYGLGRPLQVTESQEPL